MHQNNYIYFYSYDNAESDLCKLESRHLFNKDEKNKLLFTDLKVDPSRSAFLKKRLEIQFCSPDFTTLLKSIEKESINIEGFKIEYLVLAGDTTDYAGRLKMLREIGYCMEADTDYYHPTITYALCNYEGVWCFGTLIKNSFDWLKHNEKPRSYSNSIGSKIAKALVNIAAGINLETTLLDACCGAGTILLEACYSGNNIEGCDINWKMCLHARENLAHFNYVATIYRSDVKDIKLNYDAAIVDLPYNLLSTTDDTEILNIIKSTAKIANRLVIVSITDITNFISQAELCITDYCQVSKPGKAIFTREIWVCEK
jgi:tRNA G10  N-methylase Trm11